MAPGAASAVGAGARWLSGKQQPHALGGAKGSGGGGHSSLTGPSRDPQPYPIPSHCIPIPSPSPCPAAPRGEHPAAGDGEGDRAVPAPLLCPPHPPPRCHAKPRPRCRHPSPAQASGFLMQHLGRQSCRRATETLKPLCWDGERRGGMQGGPLPGGGSGPATAHPRGSRRVGGVQPGEILVLLFQPNPS